MFGEFLFRDKTSRDRDVSDSSSEVDHLRVTYSHFTVLKYGNYETIENLRDRRLRVEALTPRRMEGE